MAFEKYFDRNARQKAAAQNETNLLHKKTFSDIRANGKLLYFVTVWRKARRQNIPEEISHDRFPFKSFNLINRPAIYQQFAMFGVQCEILI